MNKNIVLLITATLLYGCASTEKEVVPQDDLFVSFGHDLSSANRKASTDSPWLSGRAVTLNVVGPIFSSDAKRQSRPNLILEEVLDTLVVNSDRMSGRTGILFSEHFSDVKRLKYDLDDEQFTYIPALVQNAFADESALNAVFESTSVTRRSGAENAEIGFYLDETAWKNKQILLSGYKTIKVEGKSRSSVWFRLRRDMPEDASVLNVKNELANMLVYAMNSSIREYASIDRGKVMLHSDYEFIVERAGGATYAYIYRDRKKMLERQRQSKIESLDKERVLLMSGNASFMDLDEERDLLLVVRSENYTGKVELISTKNANQRFLITQLNSWDEQVLSAYYFGSENVVAVITDKRVLFHDVATGKLIKSLKKENSDVVFAADKSRNLLLRLNGSAVERYSLKGSQYKSINLPFAAKDMLLSKDQTALFYMSTTGNVGKLSFKTGQKESITLVDASFNHIKQCKFGSGLLAYNDSSIGYFIDKPGAAVRVSSFPQPLKAVDCDERSDKLLTMFESGTIQQLVLSNPEDVQLSVSLEYSGYDKQNSHYLVQYMSGDEFIYGGRDDLRFRSSVSVDDVNRYYDSLGSKVTQSSDWLDQAAIDQAVYVMDVSDADKRLYQNLFALDKPAEVGELRAFMVEEPLDPILMSNQIEGFNSLGLRLQLQEEKGLKLVKEVSTPKGDGLSASVPSLNMLGYSVDIAQLGRFGFEARVYDSFSSTGLTDITTEILNVSIADNGKELMLMRSDGTLTLQRLDSSKSVVDRILDLKPFDANEQVSLKLMEHGIRAAALNEDGNLLVLATDRGILQVYDLEYHYESDLPPQFNLRKEMKSYAGNISTINFISENQVMTSGKDQIIKIWDLELGEVVGTELLGHTDTILDSVYDASLQQIVSASDDNTIRVWDPISHEQLFSFKGQGNPFVASIDAKSNQVAYINGGAVEIRNLITRDVLGRVKVNSGTPLQAIALGYESHTLFLAYSDRVEARKVSTGELIATVSFSEPLSLTKVLVDEEYRNLILVEENDVHLINIGRFKLESLRLQQ